MDDREKLLMSIKFFAGVLIFVSALTIIAIYNFPHTRDAFFYVGRLLNIAVIVFGIGVWRLKEWGRKGTVTALAMQICSDLCRVVIYCSRWSISGVFNDIKIFLIVHSVAIIALFYFVLPEVKEQFIQHKD